MYPTDADVRQNKAAQCTVPGILRSAGGERWVKFRTLSENGAMADGIDDISIGQPVSVKIRGMGWMEATIAWSVAPRCGLQFSLRPDVQSARTHGESEVADDL
jgi:hypothetical protein